MRKGQCRELCEQALVAGSSAANAEVDFERAERIARTLGPDREGAALSKLVRLYRSYGPTEEKTWLTAKGQVNDASLLADTGRKP